MNTLTIVSTTILCRVSFCECCKRVNRPHVGDLYMAYGSTKQGYHLYRAKRHARRADVGFTPHVLQLEYTNDNIVYYRYACCMYGCDVRKELNGGTYHYSIPEEKWKHSVMTKASWDALTSFKDTGYKV